MKRSASELNFEKLLKEIVNFTTDDNQILKEERIGEVRVQRPKVCLQEDEEEAADVFYADVFCAGDPGFDFIVRNTLDGFSRCGGMTENIVWSQNLNPRQSSILATMDSPSSICDGSLTSGQEPTNGGDNQGVRGNTSVSSREQSDNDDFEAGAWEQSTDSVDLKRKRRMASNKESARRSRRRKQEQLLKLELQVDKLRGENASLYKQLTDASQLFNEASTDNRVFKSNVEALRVKVKLAEDMVARGTMNYSLNNLLLNCSAISSQQPLNSNNNLSSSCNIISDICTPTSGIGSDCSGTSPSSFSIGISINPPPAPLHGINASLELPQNIMNVSDAGSCISEINWPWESQVASISKQMT